MKTVLQFELPAALGNVDAFTKAVADCALKLGMGRARVTEIEIAVEEVVVNIINYAHPDQSGSIQIECRTDESRFVIEVTDRGVAFDILSVADPDLSAGLQNRQMGGLGIFLIKRLMDDVRYRRENDTNILTLTAWV